MAEHRYNTTYTRAERNVMWTIAFVILLVVLIVWGIWYFSRPGFDASTIETSTTGETTTGTTGDTSTATSGRATGASSSSSGAPQSTSPY